MKSKLLKIVQNWEIKMKPKYRGFHCGLCKKYLYKAYHCFLNENGYLTPVHLCKKCFKKLNLKKENFFQIRKKIPNEMPKFFAKIIQKWDFKLKPVYKNLTCDNCSKKVRKAYRIWLEFGGIYPEFHFCKNCFLNYENRCFI